MGDERDFLGATFGPLGWEEIESRISLGGMEGMGRETDFGDMPTFDFFDYVSVGDALEREYVS